MLGTEGSPSRIRQYSELQDGQDLQGASKRSRLSPPLTSAAGQATSAALPDSYSNYGSDVSDGCPTPPRESESPAPYAAAAESVERWSGAVPSAREAPLTTEPAHDTRDHASIGHQANASKSEIGAKSGLSDASNSSGQSGASSDDNYVPAAAAKRTRDSKSAYSQQRRTVLSVAIKAVPAELDIALVNFIGQDKNLRAFMRTGIGQNVHERFREFQRRNGGSDASYIRRKAKKFRLRYLDFARELSVEARNTRTTEWSAKDRQWLEECEAHHVNKWLGLLHDQVYVGARIISAEAAPAIAAKPKQKAPRKVATGSVGNATSAAEPSQPLSYGEEQVTRIQDRINQQARQIALLRAQNEQQTQLLNQQAELLQRQTQQAELEAAQAQAQDDRLDQQMALLTRLQQRLESLYAA